MDQTKTEAEKLIDLQKEMGIFSDPEKPATTFGLTRPELLKLAQRSFEFASKGGDETLGQKLTGSVSDALGDISTSMLARKEKFKEQQREQDLVKAGLIEKAYGTVSDRDTLEKTLAAEKELEEMKLKQGASYEIGYRLAQLKLDFDKDIALAGGDQDKINKITRAYNEDRNNLITKTKSQNLVGTALLNNKDFVDNIKRKSDQDIEASETLRLQGEGKSQEEITEYVTSDEFRKLRERKFLEVLAGYATVDVGELLASEDLKDGGRVGLAQGGMPGAPMADQSAAQSETGLSFSEVRARLPQEISDDIVRLIVSSPMAFEDFAGIQTQIDVENFNSKYNVNLSLPQEA
jgi:flagellar biosynthesis chaperone FliJ